MTCGIDIPDGATSRLDIHNVTLFHRNGACFWFDDTIEHKLTYHGPFGHSNLNGPGKPRIPGNGMMAEIWQGILTGPVKPAISFLAGKSCLTGVLK